MNVGNAIKVIRKEKGLSQEEFSNLIAISQTSLSQIELGKKDPSKSTMKKICHVFKISPILIYLMALDYSDIPKEKEELYEVLFPSIKTMTLSLIK